MIRLLIADDHPLVRQGLAQALTTEPDFATPGEAGTAAELQGMLQHGKWDVVLLDLSMPGRGGLEVLSDIRRRRASIPVLVLTMHTDKHYVLRAMKAGANGYLNKTASLSEIVEAIREVVAGRPYFAPVVAETLAEAIRSGKTLAPHERLSDRELLVMCRIAGGKTVSEVAEEISLSVKTVHTHRARALKKMGMRTTAEFTRYALQHGLVA